MDEKRERMIEEPVRGDFSIRETGESPLRKSLPWKRLLREKKIRKGGSPCKNGLMPAFATREIWGAMVDWNNRKEEKSLTSKKRSSGSRLRAYSIESRSYFPSGRGGIKAGESTTKRC